jgi:small-conductance mechanosensitive channel
MNELFAQIKGLVEYIPLLKTILIAILIFFVLNFFIMFIKGRMLKRAKTKKQRSNVEIFSRVIRIILLLVIVFGAVSSYYGSLTGLGIWAGLFSAALGWALQRPITGVAAWIMIVTRRPFEIGDRILIGDTRGDVSDISMTHIYLKEVGGTIASEESSGRIILIPNSILFEQKIINYTMQDDFILDEAITLITYESNLEKAKEICYKAGLKFLDKELKESKEFPIVRVFQQDSGIHVKVRYKVRTSKRIETLSNIHNEIITNINQTKGVDIAYPHIHLIK